MYKYTFLLRMTDTMTSQNIKLSSWDILYKVKSTLIYFLWLKAGPNCGVPTLYKTFIIPFLSAGTVTEAALMLPMFPLTRKKIKWKQNKLGTNIIVS
jgi:hypothetical protein